MKRRLVCAGLVLPLLLSACSWVGQEAVVDDPDLTQNAAIEETLEYLDRTEAALPAEMTLASISDAPDAVKANAPMANGMYCSGSDGGDVSDPYMVQIAYFVTGVPAGEETKYLREIRGLWESWGFTPTEEPADAWAAFENEEGYVLDVQQSGAAGTLSVGGQTPCLGRGTFRSQEDVPMRIGDEGS